MTLKYLRDLTDDSLKGVYKHNRYYQLKWFDLLEENYKRGTRDRFVDRHFEEFTKNVKKCEKVMMERGLM